VPVEPVRFYNPITSLLDDPAAAAATAGLPKAAQRRTSSLNQKRRADGDGEEGAAEMGEEEEGAVAAAGTEGPLGEGLLLMRTSKQLRAAAGIGVVPVADSLYKPIEREPRKFNPLHVPRALQVRADRALFYPLVVLGLKHPLTCPSLSPTPRRSCRLLPSRSSRRPARSPRT
jgi:hypothetical protein